VNFSLRKLIKNRASFPTDEAAIKLLYLGLRNIAQRWTMPIQNWKQAMSQLKSSTTMDVADCCGTL